MACGGCWVAATVSLCRTRWLMDWMGAEERHDGIRMGIPLARPAALAAPRLRSLQAVLHALARHLALPVGRNPPWPSSSPRRRTAHADIADANQTVEVYALPHTGDATDLASASWAAAAGMAMAAIGDYLAHIRKEQSL